MSGIYGIEHIPTGRMYVGRTSRSLAIRWSEHKGILSRGVHTNRHLQAAWKKYGTAAFRFVILEEVPPDNLVVAEQLWMDYFMARDAGCYNLSLSSESNAGVKMPPRSDQHRQRLGQAVRDRYKTPEGMRQREWQRKEGWLSLNSPESIAKRAAGHRGLKPHPDLVRRRGDSIAQTWPGFIAPDGTVYRNIHNLAAFCRDHDLILSHMLKVYRGKRNQHHGWMAIKELTDA